MHVSDDIVGYWNDYADDYDAETDHGLRDPATREAWRKEIADERYLLVADLSQKATPTA